MTELVAEPRRPDRQAGSVSSDLAAALKALAQERLDDPSSAHHSAGLHLDDVSCTITDARSFRCRATYSNGTTEEFVVAVQPDGHTWATS
jgi:hypothetical protein